MRAFLGRVRQLVLRLTASLRRNLAPVPLCRVLAQLRVVHTGSARLASAALVTNVRVDGVLLPLVQVVELTSVGPAVD